MDAEVISLLEGAVARVSGIKNLRSASEENSGRIYIEFRPGVDIDSARRIADVLGIALSNLVMEQRLAWLDLPLSPPAKKKAGTGSAAQKAAAKKGTAKKAAAKKAPAKKAAKKVGARKAVPKKAAKKAANYQKNVAKAGKFLDYTKFYQDRGTDTSQSWFKSVTRGHTMAKTKYDWSGKSNTSSKSKLDNQV